MSMDMYEYIEFLAKETEYAMLAEVEAAPKPGLVDRLNNGSHQDMTIDTFRISARTLAPEFKHIMALSLDAPTDLILPLLRRPGMTAEARMYDNTGGINTHKGLIFSLGLITACLVRLALALGRRPLWADRGALVELIRLNTRGLTGELEKQKEATHGQVVYQNYGLKGVRQEAEEGYPAIFQTGLPRLRAYRQKYTGHDLPLLLTLLELILVTGDTNLVKRGGLKGLTFMQDQARAILDRADSLTEKDLLEELRRFDEAAIHRNLSPGGAADNLAVCIFLERVLV